jgi:hypothetical protein
VLNKNEKIVSNTSTTLTTCSPSILKRRTEGQSLMASSIARALITGFDPRAGPDASTKQLLLLYELRKGMLAKMEVPFAGSDWF